MTAGGGAGSAATVTTTSDAGMTQMGWPATPAAKRLFSGLTDEVAVAGRRHPHHMLKRACDRAAATISFQ